MRIDLTHVAYDAKSACFRADAILHDGSRQRAISCAWHGPQDAPFPKISAGLNQEALRNYR
jgi:hypothetical protein